jgi:hypothetical protein
MQQAQAEGLCLRFPENLGVHRGELTIQNGLNDFRHLDRRVMFALAQLQCCFYGGLSQP